MTTKGQPKTASDDSAGCAISIKIDGRGDVNIYNCSAPGSSSPPCPPPNDDDHTCPPVATGACVPASLGSKPKQSRQRKLDQLLAGTPVPSALGASFFHLARRYLGGQVPANPLEQRAFAILRRLPPDLQRILACARDSLDSLSPNERDRLFASDVLGDVEQPLDVTELAAAFAHEVTQHVGITVFGDAECAIVERPGQVRTQPHPGGEFPPSPVRVCRVNGLRTATFLPQLLPGDYTADEVQQRCHVVLEGSEPTQVCEIVTRDCPGHDVGGVCLRVQDVEAGQSVVLEGVNFSSVDTKVRLTEVATSATRDVDTRVCGDRETPLTELVDGTEVPILDCRVHDRLTFQLPEDLPPGLYDIQVLVSNVGGDPTWGDVLFPDGIRASRLFCPLPDR